MPYCSLCSIELGKSENTICPTHSFNKLCQKRAKKSTIKNAPLPEKGEGRLLDRRERRRYSTINRVPAPISRQPMADLGVTCSCRNTAARTSVITTLSLSIGTTLLAAPVCSAR